MATATPEDGFVLYIRIAAALKRTRELVAESRDHLLRFQLQRAE